MNDFKSLLNSLNLQDETEAVQVPFAPQASMPDSLADAAQAEAMEQAPVRVPATVPQAPVEPKMADLVSNLQDSYGPDSSSSSLSQIKTKISGTIPGSDTANGSETAEARLERLMRDLNEQRNKEREEAASRKFKADIFKIIGDSAGGIIGGAQAMNTKAAINPIQTKGYDVGDLVGEVDKRFAGDRQALLDQYQQLLNARDRSDQRKFQQESLNVQREGNRIKQKLAEQKANKIDNILTDGEKKSDENFAKDFNNLTSKGFNNAETAISRIEKVAEELEKEGDGFLAAGGGRTSVLSDSLRSRDSIRWRDAAQNEANATLKELFPGSLSDDERRAAAKEFYNDQLSNSENAKILKAKAAQLKQNVADQRKKAEIFSRYGTLAPRVTGNEIISAPTGQQNTINNSETVERLDKATGKIAIFDAQTKQFLKYKD